MLSKHIIKTLVVSFLTLAGAVALASGNSTSPNAGPPPPPPPPGNHKGIFMVHYDLQRTGVNPNETVLTPENVGPGTFGKITSFQTAAYTLAQPLYVTGVNINGAGTLYDVVYVATEDDSVYAFDASGNTVNPLWFKHYASIYTPANQPLAATDIPAVDEAGQIVPGGCPDIAPQDVPGAGPNPPPPWGSPGTTIGITGTPAVDPLSETLYVVTLTKDTTVSPTAYHSKLHALDINTGAEKFGGPVEIAAPNFSAQLNNQREGLTLTPDGNLLIGFSSSCDTGPYAGTILVYNANTLRQVNKFQSAGPIAGDINGQKGLGGAGIWSLGTGPAVDVDSSGNVSIFTSTGNGVFDCDPNNSSNHACKNFGCSVLRLSDVNGNLSRADYFTPNDQANLNTIQVDLDVGSGGMTVLPDMKDASGNTKKLLVTAGKSGQVYVIDRTNMGAYEAYDIDFGNIAQSFNLNGQPYAQDGAFYSIVDGLFGTPAYFNGKIYFAPVGDAIKAYQFVNGQIVAPAGTAAGMMAPADQSDWTFGWPGGTPVISANGTSNAILWFIDTSRANSYNPNGNPATLYAYDATQMAFKPGRTFSDGSINTGMLFTSDLSARNSSGNPVANPADVAGDAVKHLQPVVYNGRVFVATRTEIDMYGLTGGTPVVRPTPLPVVLTPPSAGAAVTLTYDPTKTAASGCPEAYTPAFQYNFHVQLCGGPYAACETATTISGGNIDYLDEFVNIPSGATPYQIPLNPNSSYNSTSQYEIIPGTNQITIGGVAGALTIENPTPFTVASGFTDVALTFYVNCAPGAVVETQNAYQIDKPRESRQLPLRR